MEIVNISLSLYFCAISFVFGGDRNASFVKTKIVNTNCDASTQLRSESINTRFECSVLCTGEAECRRYLYCTDSKQCILYKDGTNCMVPGQSIGCSCFKKRIGYIDGNCVCPRGRYGSNCEKIITDCTHGKSLGMSSAPLTDILADIQPVLSPEPFEVLCTFGYGGWTIVFYRNQNCETGDFYKTLTEYEDGFGANPVMNGWLGLTKWLYILNGASKKMGTLIYTSDTAFCVNHYTQFRLGSKSEGYTFNCASVTTRSCGDSLTGAINLNGMKFSALGSDYSWLSECVNRFRCGWWYSDTNSNCTRSLLTGTVDGSGTDVFWTDDLASSNIPKFQIKLQ
ncbi:hypothetical protein LOTGIDRAFT_166579 [Lottia gigantea]|uniref:Fibrinogen C-terminal domain-containing protein n=1 Tax=Lottia gigantea TaxID=225164 RepID=V4A2C6_LOTGI|nr:hypothetical protein LOTGIDRAFT_166579 [Lottia gigantea]ESO87431.1 hypothetical protein LOTGIDRAFT_166579 [Lottia gigantea]